MVRHSSSLGDKSLDNVFWATGFPLPSLTALPSLPISAHAWAQPMEMAAVLGRLHSLGYPRATMEQRSLFITISQEFPKTPNLETIIYKHAGHWMDLTLHTNKPRLPKPPWRFMLAQVVFRHDQAWERPWVDETRPEDSRSRDKATDMKWRWGLQKTGTTSIYGCLLSPSGLCEWHLVCALNVCFQD